MILWCGILIKSQKYGEKKKEREMIPSSLTIWNWAFSKPQLIFSSCSGCCSSVPSLLGQPERKKYYQQINKIWNTIPREKWKVSSQKSWWFIRATTLLTYSVSYFLMRKRPQVILMQKVTHIFVIQWEFVVALHIARGNLYFYPNAVFSKKYGKRQIFSLSSSFF